MSELRPYRLKARLMGQSSPPGLGHEVMLRVVGDSVADVGCGSGVVGYLLRAAWEFTDAWMIERVPAPTLLVGVDWSKATLDAVRKHNPFDELHLASSTVVPLADKYVDTVISMENLEHLLPGEVGPALEELARVARKRILISTPAPWTVVNISFLEVELAEARADQVPMDHTEFLDLVGRLHKSSVTPEQMGAAGFTSGVNRVGAAALSPFGAIHYTASPEAVDVSRLGEVIGVPWQDYPCDDGRSDWRAAYVDAVQDSMAMPTPRMPPAKVRASAFAKALRDNTRW